MTKYKVWGGLTFQNGKQVRTIVATKTKKIAAELVSESLYYFNRYWCETGNDIEIKIALGKPEYVFKSSGCFDNDFKQITKGE